MKKMKKEPGKERVNKNAMSKTNKYDIYGEINGIGDAIDANSKTKLINKESDDLDYDSLMVEMKIQLKEEVAINDDAQTKAFSKAMNETWISGNDDDNGNNDTDDKYDYLNGAHHKYEEKGNTAFQCKNNNTEGEK